MAEEKKSYGLVPVISKDTGKYVLEHYDEVLESCKKFIEENDFVEVNEDNYKALKEARTEIRSRQDAIKDARIQINEMLLGDFNAQLKELETLLKNADEKLKGMKDEFDKNSKNTIAKPTVIKLVVKSYDAKVIEKIKAAALKAGCEVEVK